MKKTILVSIFAILAHAGLMSQNNYLNFDGSDDYVHIDDNNVYDFSGDFTIEAKFQRDMNNVRGDIFIKKDLNSIPQSSSAIGIFISTNNKINLWLRETTVSTPVLISSTTLTAAGVWYHVAGLRVGNTVELYVNGDLEASGTVPFDLTSDGPIRIGSNRSESLTPNSAPSFPHNGDIDEVRIWTLARTISEIQINKNGEMLGTETGLVGYYNFNHGVDCGANTSVLTLSDNTSSANDGTLNNFDLTGNQPTPCVSNWNEGSTATSVSAIENDENLILFPNPVSTYLNVQLKSQFTNIKLRSVTGQLVQNYKVVEDKIDVSNLSNGIYFIKLTTEKGVVTQKFIKQ